MQLLEESLLEIQVNPLYFRLACWHTSVSHIVNFDAPPTCTAEAFTASFIADFISDVKLD